MWKERYSRLDRLTLDFDTVIIETRIDGGVRITETDVGADKPSQIIIDADTLDVFIDIMNTMREPRVKD